MTEPTPVLELDSVVGGYGNVTVLRDINLQVNAGEVVALLGPNGAGKTTLLRAVSGLLSISSGSIRIAGETANRLKPSQRARRGVCLIPEGRGIFRNLTVKENLRIAAPSWVKEPRIDLVLEAFPILAERQKQIAGTMSGGQQQMLALSRAVLAEPKIVLVDEVSMGLAPVVVDVIFEALQTLASGGVALLLVEQYIERALALSDRAYLIKKGEIVFSGPASQLDGSTVMAEYMGQISEPAAT